MSSAQETSTRHRANIPVNKKKPDGSKSTTSNPDPAEPEDAELVQRSQKGDREAFDLLVTRYRGQVYAVIVNMVHNEADAWDLAQDSFLKAWKALPKFEARSAFYTWLYRIAHNVTYDWLRKKKIQTDCELDDHSSSKMLPGSPTNPKETPGPDKAIRNRELGDRIKQAIATLSPDHRTVILLKEIEGLQYQEIADVVGCSIGTVMSRLFYARKKLQSLLKDVYENH